MSASITWISIAPVKGMRIQALDAVDLTPEGVPGDRAFFLVDPEGAMVNGKRHGSLMELLPDHDPGAGTLDIRFPDGSVVGGSVDLAEPETVTFFGNDVTARPVGGEFSRAISEHVGADLRLMSGTEGRGGVDRGKWGGVTVLGLASLDRLREAGRDFNCEQGAPEAEDPDPGPIDQRRFRMTFGVDGIAPYEEDEWLGREVRIGDAIVKFGGHVGRCAVTTRDPESGSTDLKTLHFLKHSRSEVDSFEPLPFGIYGQVMQPGRVRIGDAVAPLVPVA